MPKLKLNARPMTWTSKRRGKVPKYKYSTMQEISNNETFDNSSFYYVYGIVADFKEATKSKGSDYFSLVFLVDDTSQVPLRIRLFNRDPNFLPKVDIGDIIRLHRLKAYRYDEVVLNTVKGWSWVLWRHKDDILTSEKASSDSYTLTSSDRDMVDKLREWFKDHSGAISGGSQKFKRIQEINHNDHFSLVCQVLDFKEVSSTHIVLKVWDGTNPNITFHHFLESEVLFSVK